MPNAVLPAAAEGLPENIPNGKDFSRRAILRGLAFALPTLSAATLAAGTKGVSVTPLPKSYEDQVPALDRANYHLFMAAMALNELTADRAHSRWFAQFYGAPTWKGPVIEAFRFDAGPDREIPGLTVERRTRLVGLHPWACPRAMKAGEA